MVLFQEEYLLNAPNALGVFALVKGISQRPPLQWSSNVSHVAYHHPYILALNDEFITVHRLVKSTTAANSFFGEFP